MITREKLLAEVAAEQTRARTIHPPLVSAHEGLGVLEEEFHEVKLEIFKKVHDNKAMREELVQLAASCLNFIEDVIEGK